MTAAAKKAPDLMAELIASFHADDGRQTVEIPAVDLPARPNVVTFTAPRERTLFEVFVELRIRCSPQEPREIRISRTSEGWNARASL